MNPTRRQALALAGAAGATLAAPALAQSPWPNKPVCFVVPFPPGQAADIFARLMAEKLGEMWKQQVIVENKAGAGGQIAIQSMKGAATDGSVILQTPASMLMIYPHIYKKLAYDAFTDVTPVTLACVFDFGFCVGPAVPDSVKNIPEFLAWCKANPDKANYGSP
eukprot:gene46581-biopygen39668